MTDITDVIQGMQLGREATMDTEELFVHDGCERKRTERLHSSIVDTLRILALAYRQSILVDEIWHRVGFPYIRA